MRLPAVDRSNVNIIIRNLGCALLLASTTMKIYADEFSASIMHADHAGSLSVIPLLYTGQPGSYDYEVLAYRTGKRGTSDIRQSGQVRVEGGELKPVTKLNLNYGPEDRYAIHFRVFDASRLVAESELHYPLVQPSSSR